MALHDSVTAIKRGIADLLRSAEFLSTLEEIGSDLNMVFDGPKIVHTEERDVAPEMFPAAELIATQSAPDGESSAQQYNHRIDVLWTVNGDDIPTLVAHLESLVLATRRITWRGVVTMRDHTTAPLEPGLEEYGPLLRGGDRTLSPLVKEARIQLIVPTLA